ncbi:hypothetical protein GYMLUDRAFT_246789 [Collybiopsis luxurians FD-317 M1]|uniref:Uncharacterized protein n=1 Tax=Collybiopsis luxurians FD-317 M1 TaxID=944289 RepID=A0A0D0BRH5_9AGAR|nr:hypothetical protein GYMLUDRAFT_246789 [Collybiopsis luxurians FD-317 M1]
MTNSPSFSRFSRMGFGLLKSHSPSPTPQNRGNPKQDDERDWYIPYNGPYEQPRDTYRRDKEPLRDSWGDPVVEGPGVNDDDLPILDDEELHNRYTIPRTSTSGNWSPADERKGRPRARTQSTVSGRTVSSGTVDPNRLSMAAGRRYTVSNGSNHPPVPSYINLDTTGGVGESPVPNQRNARDTASSRRKSLTSLFTFNSSSKKRAPSPKVERQRERALSTTSRSSHGRGPSKLSGIPTLPSDPTVAEQILRTSAAGDEMDYYNSYYSTLQSPNNNQQMLHQSHHTFEKTSLPRPSSPQSPPIATTSEPSSATHPYAYVLSTAAPESETVLSAPPPKTHFDRTPIRHLYPEKFPSRIVNSHSIPQVTLHPPGHSLQNSISTPDLRNATRATPRTKSTLPKGKDRWLSAETWCDALLFPRPRFKIKQDKSSKSSRDSSYSGSGRIVSPPGSPVSSYFHNVNAPQNSIASRVLAHSRSMMDLREPGPSTLPQANVLPRPEVREQPDQSTLRPPRPKSWALDDLALPSPVPSLARVLEEGQILEHQRKKWQTQAVNSFQNQRARSLSRARTKSLTNKQPKRKDDSKLDFLAARGLLGDQNVIPINIVKRRADSQTESRGTVSGQASSHHHSSSLTKSLTTKSSKSHSRNHSRSESLGKSAVRAVKNTANAFCTDGEGISPAEDKATGLEGALNNNTTKVIKLADPAQLYIESPLSSHHGHSVSPTPSRISDSRMGVALTTPPSTEEAVESIRMPSHPYAQGGFSIFTPATDLQSNARARVQPPTLERTPDGQTLAPTAWHPYAKAGSSSRDSYQSEMKILPQTRPDSNVPPPQKMWAQWSSGIVKEILPNEIQYSPYLPDQHSVVGDDSKIRRQVRNSSPIYDTAGVGEALAFAAMEPYSRDSGIGTSEEHTPAQVEYDVASGSTGSSNRYRKTVQYDVTRPLYLQKNALPTSPLQVAITSTNTPPTEPVISRQDSGGDKSSDSSPPISPPPPLGNVDDFENFHDLFYRPSISRNISQDGAASSSFSVPRDVVDSVQRGSGLTSIARQLSEEINGSGGSLNHSISLRSQSSLSALRQSLYDARTPPADANMRFVFSDIPETVSLNANGERKNVQAKILTFNPSVHIPEDVESSRASSPMRSPVDNADGLDDFRLGNVEPVTTPPAVSGENRISFAGQMAFATSEVPQPDNHDDDDAPPSTARMTTAHSSLQPPSSSVPTRSSYMTTSDGSRMSGLSDFPEPPPQRMTPAHMSLLSSYFDNAITEKEIADVQAYGHVKPATRSRSGSVLTSRPEAQISRPVENPPRSEQQDPKS